MDVFSSFVQFPRKLVANQSVVEHPRAKKYYSPAELCAYADFFKKPLFERGMDSSYYKETTQKYIYEISHNWEGSKLNHILINNAVNLMMHCYSNGEQRRKDGTPFETHPLSVACCLDRSHSTSLEVSIGAIHDLIEDSRDRILKYSYASPFSIHAELVKSAGLSRAETELLGYMASAAVWGAQLLTNKLPMYGRQKLIMPEDIYSKGVFLYQEDKHRNYQAYMRRIYGERFLFPAKVKAVDGNLNTSSLAQMDSAEARTYFDLFFTTAIKKIMELDLEKKWKYILTYQALHKNLPSMLSKMEENFPNIREVFSLEKLMGSIGRDTDFPVNIFSQLERHRFDKSRSQKFYEHMGAIYSIPRSDMGLDMFKQQPYARSPVIVLMALESDYERVSRKPIEIGLPRHVGSGDPSVASNFVELDENKAVEFYQHVLHSYNLPFEVHLAPSIVSGYDGMDFIVLRLNFAGDGSFVSYLGNNPKECLERYEQINKILLEESQSLARSGFSGVLM